MSFNRTLNRVIRAATLSDEETTTRSIQWRGGYYTGFRRGFSAGVSLLGLLVIFLYGVLPMVLD